MFTKKIKIDENVSYALVNKIKKIDKQKIIGKGLTLKGIQEKHPNASIIGEEFPQKGDWTIKGINPIADDYDLTENIYSGIYNSLPSLVNDD